MPTAPEIAWTGLLLVPCLHWRLRRFGTGTGTEISVHVEIPDQEARRLDSQRDIIRQSLVRLAALAAAGG